MRFCSGFPAGIGQQLARKCGGMQVGAIVFSKEYGALCETTDARALLQREYGGKLKWYILWAPGSGAVGYSSPCAARDCWAQADVVIYAGSLVNPELLKYAKPECEIHDSAKMTLEEVIGVIRAAEAGGQDDRAPAHRRFQHLRRGARAVRRAGQSGQIAYDVCPGVSAFCGAAAALRAEYTLPDVSQTVIITRAAGRTPVPEREINPVSCRPSCNHGAVSEYLADRAAAGRPAGRRL